MKRMLTSSLVEEIDLNTQVLQNIALIRFQTGILLQFDFDQYKVNVTDATKLPNNL